MTPRNSADDVPGRGSRQRVSRIGGANPHGNSFAALSIGASDSRERLKSLLRHCGKISFRSMRRCCPDPSAAEAAQVAAFVIEPNSITLGILIPDYDVIRRVRELCRRYGTLFTRNFTLDPSSRVAAVVIGRPIELAAVHQTPAYSGRIGA
jgi:adenosylmethionine-8-amino-7-oxononanoate aminotransferase